MNMLLGGIGHRMATEWQLLMCGTDAQACAAVYDTWQRRVRKQNATIADVQYSRCVLFYTSFHILRTHCCGRCGCGRCGHPPDACLVTVCAIALAPGRPHLLFPQNPLLWSLVAALVVNLSGLRVFLDPDRWGAGALGMRDARVGGARALRCNSTCNQAAASQDMAAVGGRAD